MTVENGSGNMRRKNFETHSTASPVRDFRVDGDETEVRSRSLLKKSFFAVD
jgi:hypothetical protein